MIPASSCLASHGIEEFLQQQHKHISSTAGSAKKSKANSIFLL
jgi:hypothetical protein